MELLREPEPFIQDSERKASVSPQHDVELIFFLAALMRNVRKI